MSPTIQDSEGAKKASKIGLKTFVTDLKSIISVHCRTRTEAAVYATGELLFLLGEISKVCKVTILDI